MEERLKKIRRWVGGGGKGSTISKHKNVHRKEVLSSTKIHAVETMGRERENGREMAKTVTVRLEP